MEPVIRQRTRFDPDAPPRRWPAGSSVYTLGGVGDIKQQRGWVFGKDGAYKIYQRTGPGPADVKFVGKAPDHSTAIYKLAQTRLWSVGYKPTKRTESAAPAIRQRVRPGQK